MCKDHPANGIDRRQVMAGLGAGAALWATAGCVATNPATGRRSFTGFQSIQDDIALGRREHPKMVKAFGGEYDQPRLTGYVRDIGQRLARFAEFQQFQYRFTVLNSPIVNAFALPGGYVYITRGLLVLASNEAELAGVLSHEIAHVNARHTAERISAQQMAQFGLLLGAIGLQAAGLPSDLMRIGQTAAVAAIQGYSRDQEFEADTLGLRYMSRGGYHPDAMASFLGSLREHSMVEARVMGLPPGKVDEFNIMSTHPRTAERVRQAQAAVDKQGTARGRLARDTYLTRIDGMIFGDDPEQGIVRGQRFSHPGLRFEFSVPDGFHLRNSPDRVTASHRDGAAIVFDMAPMKGAGSAVQYLRRVWAPSAQLAEVENLRIAGHDAATGWVQGRGNSGPVRIRGLVIRRDSKTVYRFMYVSPQAQVRRWSAAFRESGHSFRDLSAQAAAKVQPMRLLVVPARGDDSIAGLARTLPYGDFNEQWFRVLNDLRPGQGLRGKQRLKVVAS
ncbi:MAG: M48 family metalloprotease [Alphaproteobacteria bacterium]|nr:M48 family metalloprotease [Alphaproteobacteria bacterium]MDP6565283.1 M48 family metalloprotease [Alphaproteobacteria bacterium]MDP6811781.1 M48 family metalloprotease [Alphaproteobacteria bacterium]